MKDIKQIREVRNKCLEECIRLNKEWKKEKNKEEESIYIVTVKELGEQCDVYPLFEFTSTASFRAHVWGIHNNEYDDIVQKLIAKTDRDSKIRMETRTEIKMKIRKFKLMSQIQKQLWEKLMKNYSTGNNEHGVRAVPPYIMFDIALMRFEWVLGNEDCNKMISRLKKALENIAFFQCELPVGAVWLRAISRKVIHCDTLVRNPDCAL